MTTIWLQAGHGAGDPGATHGNRTEAGQSNKLVNEAYKLAKPHLASGHKIRKMKNTDYVTAVDTFTRESGDLDLYLEVHLNSNAGTPGSGTEVLYGHQATAQTLQDALVKELGLPNRGIKQRDEFYVTSSAIAGGVPSGVIIEMAFINNNGDMEVINNRGSHALATALVSLSYGKYTKLPSPEPSKLEKITKLAKDRLRKLRNVKDKNARLTDKIKKLESKNRNLKSNFEDLEQELDEKTSSHDELIEIIGELEDERNDLQEKLNQHRDNSPSTKELIEILLDRLLKKLGGN